MLVCCMLPSACHASSLLQTVHVQQRRRLMHTLDVPVHGYHRYRPKGNMNYPIET